MPADATRRRMRSSAAASTPAVAAVAVSAITFLSSTQIVDAFQFQLPTRGYHPSLPSTIGIHQLQRNARSAVYRLKAASEIGSDDRVDNNDVLSPKSSPLLPLESLHVASTEEAKLTLATNNGTSTISTAAATVASATPTVTYPPVPTLRECLSFMLPALGIYAAPPLMSLIDAAFIGRTSSIELAALGPASSISDSASLPLLFLSIAATNLIAKSMSKGDAEDCRRVTRACLGLGTVGGTVIALAVFVRRHWLSALYCGELGVGATEAMLAPFCSTYVAIRSLALPAVVVASIAQAVCIGIKDTKTPMAAVLLAAVLNFFGDLILVPGLGLGIAGAAWATTMSQICAAALLLRVLAKRGLLRGGLGGSQEAVAPVNCNVAATGPDMKPEVTCEANTCETIRTILGFIPFLFVMGVKMGMHNTAAATAASLGGAPAAAHTALFAVGMLCFTFGDTGSSLSQAFLPAFASNDCEIDPENPGSAKGKRKTPVSFNVAEARPTISRLLACTFTVSATVIAISTAMLTIFAGQLTNDPAVIYQMRRALPFMAATLCFHGTAVTLEGLLLAQQNFRGLTVTYGAVAMSIAAMLGYVRTSGLGLLGVWATYVWFQLSRVVAFSVFGGLLPNVRLKTMERGS